MKIGIMADVHGNLPALEAVMADMKERGVDRIICLGDMVGGANPKEALEICRDVCDEIVRGNWEVALWEQSLLPEVERDEKAQWFIDAIGPEQVAYLGTLPHSREISLGGKLIRLFHAHPRPGNYTFYYGDSPGSDLLEFFDFCAESETKKAADMAIYAHIHFSYMRVIDGRQILNTGSVGVPLDGMPQASYVILEGDSALRVQFIRVPYDIEKAVAMATERGIPDLEEQVFRLRNARASGG